MFIKAVKKIPFVISALSAFLVLLIAISETFGIIVPFAQVIFVPGTPLYFNYFFLYNCIAIIISLFLAFTKRYRPAEAFWATLCNLVLCGVIFCMILTRM